MLLTEKEALTKNCCGGCAAHPQHSGTCTASECMAWRWALLPNGNRRMKPVAPPTICPDCNGEGCAECDGDGKVCHFETVGYCALAAYREAK